MNNIIASLRNIFLNTRSFFEANKVFIEVLSFMIVGLAGIYVSYNSYRISESELELHRSEFKIQENEFKLQQREFSPIFRIEILDTTEFSPHYKRELKAWKVSGYADNVTAKISSFLVVSKYDSIGKASFTPLKFRTMGISYYSPCINEIGKKGYISSFLSEYYRDYSFLKYSVENEPFLRHFTKNKDDGYYYSIEIKSVLIIKFYDILGVPQQLLYEINKGGNQISPDDYNNNYYSALYNNDPNGYELKNLKYEEIIKIVQD